MYALIVIYITFGNEMVISKPFEGSKDKCEQIKSQFDYSDIDQFRSKQVSCVKKEDIVKHIEGK